MCHGGLFSRHKRSPCLIFRSKLLCSVPIIPSRHETEQQRAETIQIFVYMIMFLWSYDVWLLRGWEATKPDLERFPGRAGVTSPLWFCLPKKMVHPGGWSHRQNSLELTGVWTPSHTNTYPRIPTWECSDITGLEIFTSLSDKWYPS